MKRSFLLILCGLALLSLSACSADTSPTSSTASDSSVSTSVISVDSTIPERFLKEIEVSAPKDSISFEEAVTQLQRCLSTDLSLPDTPSSYQAFYAGTTVINDTACYRIDLYYQNENGTPIFVGVPYAVSCDGKNVFAKALLGDYLAVQPVDEDKQKSHIDIYGSIAVAPNDAIEKLCGVISEFKLSNAISDYYLYFNQELTEIMEKQCYRITVTGYTSTGQQMAAFAFVSVSDGIVYKADPSNNTQYIALSEN